MPVLMEWNKHGLLRRTLIFISVAILVCTILAAIYGSPRMTNDVRSFATSKSTKRPNADMDVHGLTSQTKNRTNVDTGYKAFYDDEQCITERSNISCNFPLLTDYHRRCGYFPGSTSWTHISAGFPKATMSAQICRVPPVSSAPSRLSDYIRQRKISSVVIFGDSQGKRYSLAFFKTLSKAGFRCTIKKSAPLGFHINLDYYTDGSIVKPKGTVSRTCKSCNSELSICSNNGGHKVSVEYISMTMATSTPLGRHCSDSHHPLCQNITHQEYVLKHYLRRTNSYPQLLLFFSTFAHDRPNPLAGTYNGMRYLYDVITRNVPASATVIWYNAPGYHALKHTEWYTSEGEGFSPNDKIQVENHFLSKLQILHHESGNTPAMYSFFDLYHMDEQLRGAWDADHVHYKPSWYAYVIDYTAAMLPSIPIP